MVADSTSARRDPVAYEPTPQKCRPIHLDARTVRSVLREGCPITQVRIPVRLPAGRWELSGQFTHSVNNIPPFDLTALFVRPGTNHGIGINSPCGVPGDRLWVRETWQILTGNGHRLVYRADVDPPMTSGGREAVKAMRWRPSSYMRRRHSRITLDVTSVHVERLAANPWVWVIGVRRVRG